MKTISDLRNEKSDLLVGIMLRDQMKQLINIELKAKRHRRSTYKNSAMVAAFKVLAHHVKEDLTLIDSTIIDLTEQLA